MSARLDTAPPPDCVPFEDEPDVERVRGCWYARDVFVLIAEPHGLPEHIVSELRGWARGNDENVRTCRPFCVEGGLYSFDYFSRRDSAPQWWVSAGREWCPADGRDRRGRRLR